jgi:ferredoxin
MADSVLQIDQGSCVLCGQCVAACQEGALELGDDKLLLDSQKCKGCGDCLSECPNEALSLAEGAGRAAGA